MIHLTLCGFDAGRPICDCNKPIAAANGDTFIHAMYWNEDNPHTLRPSICPACLQVWDEVDAE
jgi:hypothetical protein